MISKLIYTLWAGCLLLPALVSKPAFSEVIHVAAASNFTAPMKELVSQFEQSTGHKVRLSFGSSGKFFAQIRHGAPFQVFFSADQAKPKALEQAGYTVMHSRFTYAVGALALWSAKPGFIDPNTNPLKQGKFNKLALANPRLAPYGAAAVEVLENLALVAATRGKWVQGENIAQTYQFTGSGNADIGFVSLSQILQNGKVKLGSAWIVPENLYSPIRQDAVLLKKGKNSEAAQALLRFVKSDRAREIIGLYGYKTAGVKS
ncbi:molybdate ABC transporter substrate-binding protein [Thalassomonas viridans]|uniref:Molybdate ABC transporter substrate-binding protein n=1 Tax=Thalassomonas viridans TaxID=137584 RepID=A0AAE9ZA88_9GAMM|nr:molybdate ABC transporter substrate-binding protein [Thalassomonas viridans]WDE08874.1 molybdate ABC transporter substrate-binding protein [Thalassomonas viridans]